MQCPPRSLHKEVSLVSSIGGSHPSPKQCSAVGCKRRISSYVGWKQHYWSSPHHPHCGACGEGLQYREEVDEHLSLVHPRFLNYGAIVDDSGTSNAPLPEPLQTPRLMQDLR
ncbi:hypothetical protein FIBSPDRAFT_270031 [Athelia psychrophila]|uniref:C2H2-type domain-containing protein n=1 Tax=Athelia psychrophila TaxID=1759441 RepID=A0A165X172_9AGAM|nr:hypothetical protein FIBSPDRAFT_270031 [Fibularhizoctonia sp. CBS 109695]